MFDRFVNWTWFLTLKKLTLYGMKWSLAVKWWNRIRARCSIVYWTRMISKEMNLKKLRTLLFNNPFFIFFSVKLFKSFSSFFVKYFVVTNFFFLISIYNYEITYFINKCAEKIFKQIIYIFLTLIDTKNGFLCVKLSASSVCTFS